MFINVNEYKNLASDSDMINAAICDSLESGKIVVIPKINERTGKDIWDITKTIVLYGGTTLILNQCHLRMNDNAICKMMINSTAELPYCEENIERNITIKGIGKAILDGGVHSGVYENNGIARKVPQKTEHKVTDNFTLYLKNIEHLVVEGLQITKHRYWGIRLEQVSYGRISNIHFSSAGNVPNQDGLDLVRGCHDIIVENITGYTGDNLIALNASGDIDLGKGDIRNITIRNVMGYGLNGCALIRILNHDGHKIYNIHIDNIIETSPWSEHDANLAQNPDLLIQTDENGNILPWRRIIPGEIGYRLEAAIIIGEMYWFKNEKAKHGDTYGITVTNVSTHARYAIWVNNTLMDSSFQNIRLFGNAFMAAYFGAGEVENLRFSNISYDKSCKPVKGDEHIVIDWNKTESKGLSAIYFNGTQTKNILFDGLHCCESLESVTGGFGTGDVVLKSVKFDETKPKFKHTGITITEVI